MPTKMKRKLIEHSQEQLIVCDNISCDFKLPYSEEQSEILCMYINLPCPKCGENLLTYEDYIQHEKIKKIVNWINKWFSWITIFYSKKDKNKGKNVTVNVHNGIEIKIEK